MKATADFKKKKTKQTYEACLTSKDASGRTDLSSAARLGMDEF
jgi:hypothetical protein